MSKARRAAALGPTVIAPVSHLTPGTRIVAAPGTWSGAVLRVLHISASVHNPDALVLTVISRRKALERLVYSKSMPIEREVRGDRPVAQTAKSPGCSCVNHLGSLKIRHKSRAAAVEALMRRHLQFGGHRIYECPNEAGIFHITSRMQAPRGGKEAA